MISRKVQVLCFIKVLDLVFSGLWDQMLNNHRLLLLLIQHSYNLSLVLPDRRLRVYSSSSILNLSLIQRPVSLLVLDIDVRHSSLCELLAADGLLESALVLSRLIQRPRVDYHALL